MSLEKSINEKILIVLGNFAHMGGAERQAFHLIQYLRETVQAPVAVLGWFEEGPLSDQLKQMGCEIHIFSYNQKQSGWKKYWTLFQMARYIRTTIKADVILPFVSVHSKPVCLIKQWTGARYVWWNQQDEGRGLYKTDTEKRALLNASHITSNSMAGAEFIHESYGIPMDKILVYNNGTPVPDSTQFKPIWREKLGLAEGQQLVCMLANIIPFKEHGTLLKAWSLMLQQWPAQRPKPFLALAGHHSKKQHVLETKALAFDLQLDTTVRFLGPIDSTNELIYESDMVVHSSIREGCPNAVCEAMALGRAVVGTDISGIRQALGDAHGDQVYAKPHDPQDLCDKLLAMLTNDTKREAIGKDNLKRIMEDFSIQGMNEYLYGLFQPTGANQ